MPGITSEQAHKKIIGDGEPITRRPGDLPAPGLEEARAMAAPHMGKEEHVLSVAIFPQVPPGFLQERLATKLQVDLNLAKESSVFYPA